MLKTVFVEVAARDFDLPDRKTSLSRIAILTGLTRKEVAKQQEILRSGALDVDSNLNRVIRVLEGWHSDPDIHRAVWYANGAAVRIADSPQVSQA